MAESEQRGSNAALVWGIFILFFGIVLLLQATGVVEWRLWGTLWKFWPVIIILLGLAIIIPRRLMWLVALVEVAVLGISFWISAAQYTPSLAHDVTIIEQRFTYPSVGVERVSADVEFAAGSIVITDLQTSQLLAEISDGHEPQGKPQEQVVTMDADFSRQGDTVLVNVSPVNDNFWDNWSVRWRFAFNPAVPVSMEIRCEGSRLTLDIEDLELDTLNLVLDVSSGILTLPATAGDSLFDIDLDVSNLEIIVPQNVAVKMRIENNLSMVSIDQDRFLKQGDYYISADYEIAANGVELNILCDVSRLVVR
jgi:hypothetical protein